VKSKVVTDPKDIGFESNSQTMRWLRGGMLSCY